MSLKAKIEVLEFDITRLGVDAIVNAANESLAPGGGVCGAIHRAAGPELARECTAIGSCPTGQAVITKGYKLPAKYVIHTVGPVWRGGVLGEDSLLSRCYSASLDLAKQKGLLSIAFPAISTGIFGYPKDRAAKIAAKTVTSWVESNRGLHKIILCCMGDESTQLHLRALEDL